MSDVESVWGGLSHPDRASVSAKKHPSCEGVFLGVDGEGRRHLLVRVDRATPTSVLLRTKGLHAEVVELQLDGEPVGMWADLACQETNLNETFATVADELAAALIVTPADSLGAVQRTLGEWQWFWGVERKILSDEAEIGVFGELWFIDQWLAQASGAKSWMGPRGNRHDFVSPELSIEVKTVRSIDGSGRHRIANLQQLADPDAGRLLLFSLQIAEDAGAGNSLNSCVDRIREKLAHHPELLATFDESLAIVGWTAVSRHHFNRTFRIIAQGLYRVDSGFPRLTAADLGGTPPAGVTNITYSIDMTACGDFLIATTPNDARPILKHLL